MLATVSAERCGAGPPDQSEGPRSIGTDKVTR
jgi:hypothetical protein